MRVLTTTPCAVTKAATRPSWKAGRGVTALLLAILLLSANHALAQTTGTGGGVQFSKIDTLGTSFLTWLKGNPITLFFTVALIVTGLLAAFNRISWMWVLMICVGAFFAFGATNIVTQLKAVFT
ncbi:TrbC/VirB2 family protein [Paracoccus sp. M683]|uniref:TrbC/VirB2 family protein n=1 Tax=Paracoccus sp. M683 TaxID=2594268 RepID=UPI00117EB4F3|nr:TrbC/VirB2 family protein [Paracoccus sp. M683]TRW94289.1 TrbC/VirB2 family protein [Paracoccus sp. M683]